jgi:hypothetical protein
MIPAVGKLGPALLFSALTVGFVVIGIAAASAERWVIVVATAALAVWMASFAWSALRRIFK